MQKQHLSATQMDVIDRRLKEHAKVQPEIRELKKILLQLGGCHVEAPLGPEPDMTSLVRSGFVVQGQVLLKLMDPNACHLNASKLWVQHKHGIVAIGTGYALSDGVWRQHSWGVRREGLIETTGIREKYFGIVLWDRLADCFALSQYITNGVGIPSSLRDMAMQLIPVKVDDAVECKVLEPVPPPGTQPRAKFDDEEDGTVAAASDKNHAKRKAQL